MKENKRKTRYERIDTNTLAGLRKAERRHAAGWKIIAGSLFISGMLLMESPKGGI